MVGSNKILTVSYGTFSCTLEGFDEPFNTMKAIAEYFRDLAADDRYFGAEPPTPDAEMLQRIAEREIQRRVEARVSETGLTLRQTETAPAPEIAPATMPAAATAAEVPVNVEATPATVDMVAVAPVVVQAIAAVVSDDESDAEADDEPETIADTDDEPVAAIEFEAVEEPEFDIEADEQAVQPADAHQDEDESDYDVVIDTIMADAAQPVPMEESAAPAPILFADEEIEPESDSVAAKLARIRAVVEGVRNGTVAAFDDTEEDAVEATEAAPVDDDFAFAIDTHEDLPELVAAEAARAAAQDAPSQDLEGEVAEAVEQDGDIDLAMLADDVDSADDADSADEADKIEAVAEIQVPDHEPLSAPAADAMLADDASDDVSLDEEEMDFDDEEGDIAYAIAAEYDDETVAEAAEAAASEPEDAELMARLSELGMTADHQDAVTDARSEASEAPESGADDDLQATISAISEADDNDGDAAMGDAETGQSPSFFQRARARVIRLSKVATILGHSNTDDATGEKPAEETKAELSEAAMDAVIDETPAQGAHDEDPDIGRLMDEAKSKLEGAESRRKFSAISHLKAAVAATLADRQMRPGEMPANPGSGDGSGIEPYRDDLSKAVRPRRPSSDAASATPRPTLELRPAPLVLVSEQRIDRPAGSGAEGSVVRPRRVAAGNLAIFAEDEDDGAEEAMEVTPESASSFADFAGKLGATTLTELLEAAAVYTASIEGRPHFTRPHLLRKVEFVSTRTYNREDSLRSFGTLLRQGKIQKTGRGQFTVTDNSRFMHEARRVH